ncbi:hypothetical protein H072_6034 [Dactylellina haptotyla CBS 200.50]|uniref:SMP-30/Gluconolactonase/LRE-like region domain-containing protein n=1 Tax=Dactylellina haptotyla (strain CBS 200.50) TaxID=1284197 RepID=S8BL72_DACHA|nr:hypothetical protein H072_6034 [Dactylellina haptotyla CBS 200.50]
MAWKWRHIVITVAIAALSPYLYDVGRSIRLVAVNAPWNMPEVANFTSYEIRFGDQLRNCEDIFLDTDNGIAIISCDPGRDKWNMVMGIYIDPNERGSLYLYAYGSNPNGVPVPISLEGFDASFRPLGLTYHAASKTLAVANHGVKGSSIEIFTLDTKVPRARHRQTISNLTHLPTPNSLVFLNTTHMYVSNTHRTTIHSVPTTLLDRVRVWVPTLELRLGIPVGSVALVDLTAGTVTTVLRLGFANGIELLDDGRTLAVASSIKAAVYLYSIGNDGADPAHVTYLRRIIVPFYADNISVDNRGRVLVAGHPHPRPLARIARDNWLYHYGPRKLADRPHAPSWVSEWDPKAPQSDALRDIYVGNAIYCSSTAVRDVDRNILIVTGLYGHGLLVASE